MKSLPLTLAALLAGCGDVPTVVSNGAAAPAAGEPDRRIDCQPAGSPAMARACTAEFSGVAGGRVVTLRKADGGFRRVRISADGRGVIAADGAEPARITTITATMIEVQIGGDRFRMPVPSPGL